MERLVPVVIASFGYRHEGPPRLPENVPALVIDVRPLFMRNPYHDKRLRRLRGDHPSVQADILKTPGFDESYAKLKAIVSSWPGEVYLGCSGGHHRSVYLAGRLGQELDCAVVHLHY